jgi:hypothetical protein
MPIDEVEAALKVTLHWERPYQIHLTGGEPFLKFPLLLQATEIAIELGISVYVETNAGWCVREELVEQRLRALRQAGMQAVLISISPFHAETVPPERTLLAIRKSFEIFGQHRTIPYQAAWLDLLQSFGTQSPAPLEAYVDTFGKEEAGRMFWQGYSLISGGRAGYRLADFTPQRSPETWRGQNCRQELLYAHHSHFDLYGNFIPAFCGGLSLGDWHDLPQLIANYEAQNYPPVIETLIEAGPFGLFERAQNEFDYQPQPAGYSGKCHLCVDVRCWLSEHAEFPELKPLAFYENI